MILNINNISGEIYKETFNDQDHRWFIYKSR